jgi:hypothetical protein
MKKKTLKFAPDLILLVLSGKKNSTWRLWDDKDLSKGDKVDFLDAKAGAKFATAKLTKVVQKPMGKLTESDKKGHETFRSNEEMYTTYTKYYGRKVGPETLVKIVRFKLIEATPS